MTERYQPIRYLSWQETQHGEWTGYPDVPGYDPIKHEPDDGQYLWPIEVPAEPGSSVQGHFEYAALSPEQLVEALDKQRLREATADEVAARQTIQSELPLSPTGYKTVRFLTYEESQRGWSDDNSEDLAGYDAAKHDPRGAQAIQVMQNNDSGSAEEGHFEYLLTDGTWTHVYHSQTYEDVTIGDYEFEGHQLVSSGGISPPPIPWGMLIEFHWEPVYQLTRYLSYAETQSGRYRPHGDLPGFDGSKTPSIEVVVRCDDESSVEPGHLDYSLIASPWAQEAAEQYGGPPHQAFIAWDGDGDLQDDQLPEGYRMPP